MALAVDPSSNYKADFVSHGAARGDPQMPPAAHAHRAALINFCRGYLGQLDDAEDAVQEVFLKAYRHDPPAIHFRAWLYKVARNHCLNVLRSRARRRDDRALPPDSRVPGGWTGVLTQLMRSEQRSCIGHLVAALPLSYRETLRLRYVDGLSRMEIADVLDVPASVVKSRLYEGLSKLKLYAAVLR